MSESFSRRQALKGFALLAAAAGAPRARGAATAEPVHLSASDPAAVALGFPPFFQHRTAKLE